MAIRINRAVICGEIDSTERGTVRCILWMVGRSKPLVVTLNGNPWRDVAGTKVIFENKNPSEEPSVHLLHPEQVGSVGDITASRKVKHLLIPENEDAESVLSEKAMPFEWRNSLYLEWFSHTNGRVLIEGSEFLLRISEPQWTLDEAEEQAQQLSNQQAMRNFLSNQIRRREPAESNEEDESEEAWERVLEENDRLTDAHLEALEKYEGDPDEEDKTFFAMGWDHLLEGGDVEDIPRPWTHDLEWPVSEDEGEEWKSEEAQEAADDEVLDTDLFQSQPQHPLQNRTSALAVAVVHFAKLEESKERAEKPECAINRFARYCLQISGKCAGVLSNFRSEHPMPRGMILATLKRCLNYADEALLAMGELEADAVWQPHQATMSALRQELRGIRGEILALRAELGAE